MARARRISNQQVVRALRELALFLEMDEVAYKPRAYEKAADAVAALDSPLAETYAKQGLAGILEVPAVGKGIGGKIEESAAPRPDRGARGARARTPLTCSGSPPSRVWAPSTRRRFTTRSASAASSSSRRRCARVACARFPIFGQKSEQKLLRGLQVLRRASGRHLLGHALPLAREIEARLRQLPGVGRAAVAGSIRRCQETIGDLDFLAVSEDPRSVMEFFVAMPEVEHVYAQGRTKTLVRLASGIDADLRVVPDSSFGAALHYFTGSKDHNVALRRIAQEQGLKLNEYGVFRGKRAIAGSTEQEVYAALGLPYIEPELREDRGEIEAARTGRLPKLIEHGALRGDLQIQTDWTDGDDSIEAMAQAARELGLEYIAITDHTRDLKVTRGSDEEKLREQGKAIHALNRKLRGIRVLTGAEVNIRRDGSLDISDDALAELDVVGVAIHSYFDQPRDEMTRRVIRAIENPHVDVLFHPTARTLGHREPVALDIDAVIEAARRTGTLLEIDALPERLDLRDEHVRKAVEAGVKPAIDSDAHHREHLRCSDEFGIATARRGWATRKDIANAWPLEKFLPAQQEERVLGPRAGCVLPPCRSPASCAASIARSPTASWRRSRGSVPPLALVHHVGRKTARRHRTPVLAFPVEGGTLVAAARRNRHRLASQPAGRRRRGARSLRDDAWRSRTRAWWTRRKRWICCRSLLRPLLRLLSLPGFSSSLDRRGAGPPARPKKR